MEKIQGNNRPIALG